jgi:diadenosine tetraphosphate (Ap4A) HIT family hydrolase
VPADCLVCREVAGEVDLPSGLLVDEPAVVGFHLPPLSENPTPYLGHVLVVTRRHVARLGDLTPDEAGAVGRATARLAGALTETGADWVYSAVIGTGVPHFHLHLLARYPDTPRDVPWHAVDEWEGARRGGAAEIAELSRRLRNTDSLFRS